MDTAKRQRQEQLKRYYSRERKETATSKGRQSSPVVTIKDDAKLRDAASKNLVEELSTLLLQRTGKIRREDINEAFLKACIHGHKEAARLLLEHEAFIDHQDDDLWTSLHFAAARGDKTLINLLFEYNVDTTLLDVDGNFALDYASDPSVKQLIAEEMSHSGVYEEDLPSIRTRQLKAMTAAVRSGIARGKDMTLLNKNGVTPLHTAAAYGYYEVTQLLVESGRVPLSVLDSFGCTPLHVSMKYGQNQVAKYLLQQGARIEEEGPYEVNTSLNLEALTGRSSPQPLSNKWKLKDITNDDTQREKSWLRQHIGFIQDIHSSSSTPPPFPQPSSDNVYSSLAEMTITEGPISHNSTIGNPITGMNPLAPTGMNPLSPTGMNPLSPTGVNPLSPTGVNPLSPTGVNPLSPTGVNPAMSYRKGSAPVASLRAIPEMIYETRSSSATTIVTTPTQCVIEDIYDYGGGQQQPPPTHSSPIPAHMSIYDDSVVSTVCTNNVTGEGIYDDVKNLVYNLENRTEDLYDDISTVMSSGGPDQKEPHPYEKFVRMPENKTVQQQVTTTHQVQSDTDLASSSRPPVKGQRSKSADVSVPEAWLSRMHPELRRAYAPPLRRDSTPTKAPPPVPNRAVGNGGRMIPAPPPRHYATPIVRNRQLPSHPIDVPPSPQLNDYHQVPLSTHLIKQPMIPPHPPPSAHFDQSFPHPPRKPLTRMVSAPIILSNGPPPHSMVAPPHSMVPPPHSMIPPPHSIVPPPHSNVPPPHSMVVPFPQSIVPPPHSIVPPPHSNIPPPHLIAPPPHSNAPPPQSEPPPSYATVLLSPEQFSPSPSITLPNKQPRPPRYSAEPHMLNCPRPKPVLRKIASTPAPGDNISGEVMFLNGKTDHNNIPQQERKPSAKPYTFRTKFQ